MPGFIFIFPDKSSPSFRAGAFLTRYRALYANIDSRRRGLNARVMVDISIFQVIVEAVKPEWDGGSRGKVKTKGKRGKGFV